MRSVYKDGQAKFNGYLDDYAFLIEALLDMFEVPVSSSTLFWLRGSPPPCSMSSGTRCRAAFSLGEEP